MAIFLHQGPPAPTASTTPTPYPVVTVELDEQPGLRFTSTVVGVAERRDPDRRAGRPGLDRPRGRALARVPPRDRRPEHDDLRRNPIRTAWRSPAPPPPDSRPTQRAEPGVATRSRRASTCSRGRPDRGRRRRLVRVAARRPGGAVDAGDPGGDLVRQPDDPVRQPLAAAVSAVYSGLVRRGARLPRGVPDGLEHAQRPQGPLPAPRGVRQRAAACPPESVAGAVGYTAWASRYIHEFGVQRRAAWATWRSTTGPNAMRNPPRPCATR